MISENAVCDLKIVLVGKTGAGKSATGNTILGRNEFKVTHFVKSTNEMCKEKKAVVGGKTLSVIDTPGLFNTSITEEELKADIEKCIFTSSSGPHVFLLVIKLGVRFTKEERDTVKWIQENFGEEALHRTIIIFTHTDQLKYTAVDKYIGKSQNLQNMVDSCVGRYYAFNNDDKNNQVTELLKHVNKIKTEQNDYSYDMFKQAQITNTQKKTQKKSYVPKIVCALALVGTLLAAAKAVGNIVDTAGKIAAYAFEAVLAAAEGAEVQVEETTILIVEKGTVLKDTEHFFILVAENTVLVAKAAVIIVAKGVTVKQYKNNRN